MNNLPVADRLPVEVIRSTRRTRSSSASIRDGVIVVRVPAFFTQQDEDDVVAKLADKMQRKFAANQITDDELLARAHALADKYLNGVRAAEVTWSPRMDRLWGSCTFNQGRIRISDRLATVPRWVLDDVLIHEMAHLIHPDHSKDFHALVARHPHHERARGFLAGLSWPRP